MNTYRESSESLLRLTIEHHEDHSQLMNTALMWGDGW